MIEVYESVLTDDNCDALIQILENDIAKGNVGHKVHISGAEIFLQTQLLWDNEFAYELKELTMALGDHYLDKYDPYVLTPSKKKLEAFRIKRYDINVGCFPLHVDSRTIKHANRYLAFLFYLNTTDAGTNFKLWNGDIRVPCVKGNVCVFPPNFLFPHEGEMPTDKDKYIMSTYYHFVE